MLYVSRPTRALEYIFYYIRSTDVQGYGVTHGGYSGYSGIQQNMGDTAEYSGIRCDTPGDSGILLDTAGCSGIQRDTAGYY